MRATLWIAGLALWMTTQSAMAQDSTAFSHEGKFWISWGYNRAAYANSDIHFKGEGFDFTIYNVRAQDVPEQWDPAVYLNPKALTIPQFNFRAGWFINEKLSFSAGWDHMKYRISRYQRVRISGTIDALASPDYSGRYSDGALIEIDTPFIRYEHTDGFNFLRFGAELVQPMWRSKSNKVQLCFTGGAYAGVLLPWTDTYIFGRRFRNKVHLSGFGVSTTAGWRVEFLNHFFVQARAQVGWTYLHDVMIMDDAPAKAQQQISFLEGAFNFGALFRLGPA